VRALALTITAACGSATPPPAPEHRAGASAEADPLVRDCWLDPCELALDLDGDGRDDQVELVRDQRCDAGDDDRPCRQGLRITLATGVTLRVGAGRAIEELAGVDPELEPIALEADLGFVVLVRARAGAPPCPADAVMPSGGDAAAQLCVIDGEARAFHLGF
jgi:hypothetical protein